VPLHIEDKTATDAVRRLARARGLTLTEAVRVACEEALSRDDRSRPIADRLHDIHQRLQSFPPTGLKSDKAFFDREWDE
jgi:antitoxin VapB